MKINYRHLELIYQLLIQINGLKLKPTYNLIKYSNLMKIKNELVNFDKVRSDIINKYCEKDENDKLISKDNQYKIIDEFKEKFIEEMNELYKIECELSLSKLNFSEILLAVEDDVEKAPSWTDNEMYILSQIIDFDK